MASVRVRVSGRVQGVGFRAFVVREASRLALAGEVRNLPDGSVEAHAHGPRTALEAFVGSLSRGPLAARVEDAVVEWYDVAAVPRDFRVTG
ncbi:MAG: acylphosphatase [bacterium]